MLQTRRTSPQGRDADCGLVVVSNRLPYNLPRRDDGKLPKRNVGGLVNALEPILARTGGCWIGWGGSALATAGAVADALRRPGGYRTPSGVDLRGVPLSEREVRRYYHGCANRAVWPLFHNFPGKAVFEPDDFAAYRRVNQRFAEVTRAKAERTGHVWVHDFHLMLMPRFLRDAGFSGRIDFFLHIPFPAPEIFRALPWRDEAVDGLLASDSIGFHVPAYRDNFVAAARQIRGARASHDDVGALLRHGAGETRTFAAPIGVDVADFERIAQDPDVRERARRVREAHGNRFLLFGADRLDYTKGIRERLLTLERFLSLEPEAQGHVELLQVVVPSRHQVEEYRSLKQEIDAEVGRINGRFARNDWTPIHYRYVGLDREDLVAHYLAADLALVTPLRDGLNLVAAEFVASRVDGDGVLVVSEFAGVAERLDGALRVNPYDLDACARAVAQAIDMGDRERRDRMARMRATVRANPVSRWADRCLAASAAVPSVPEMEAQGASPRRRTPEP